MAETKDWKNLPGFLEGLKTAKRRLMGFQVEKMVRKANEDGKQGVVHDCLRRVEGTNMGLWDVRVAREVMWGAVLKAIQNGWSQEGVEKGVKYAENIWELMFDPRHAERQTRDSDPKKRPEVIGVLVQMHAAKAVMFGGREEEQKFVEKYSELMLKAWGNADWEVNEQEWNDANYKLLMWAPVWHAIKMARQVLKTGSPVSNDLGTKLTQDLEPLLQKTQAILVAHRPQEGRRRGLKMYEELTQVST